MSDQAKDNESDRRKSLTDEAAKSDFYQRFGRVRDNLKQSMGMLACWWEKATRPHALADYKHFLEASDLPTYYANTDGAQAAAGGLQSQASPNFGQQEPNVATTEASVPQGSATQSRASQSYASQSYASQSYASQSYASQSQASQSQASLPRVSANNIFQPEQNPARHPNLQGPMSEG